jgi:hypothetical protein
MKFYLKSFYAAILIVGFSPIAAYAVVLPIIADSHLAPANAGTAVAVNINAKTKGLLNFDPSTLPDGITSSDITKATLVFYVKTLPAKGKLQVSPLTTAWIEKTVTSKNAPEQGMPLATSATLSNKNTYFAVDVTDLVKNWIDVSATNYGLALEPATETSGTSLTIDSKEASQTSHPAYIDIALNGSTVGEKGAKGDTGSQGPKGDTGPAGAQGLAGSAGINGTNGLKGDTGATGASGSQGLQGDPGSPGAQGAKGDTGAAGPAGTPASVHVIGDLYGGGIVFEVDAEGQHGLIAATVDQSKGIQWYNGSDTLTNAVRDGINAGSYNTERIVINQGAGSYAAQLCANYQGGGYGDWYLPSKYELNQMYIKIGPGAAKPLTNVGGFANEYYWSSTEHISSSAWSQYFSSGYQYGSYGKNNTVLRVRAVRAF